MKRFFLLLLLSFFSVAYSQQSKNRFEQEERSAQEDRSIAGDRSMQNADEKDENWTQKGPGNPGSPVPIDDYLPLLVVVAVGLIVYHVRKQKQLS